MCIHFLNRSVKLESKVGKFLSSFYGISRSTSIRICRQLGISYCETFASLPFGKRVYLEKSLSQYTLGLDLLRISENFISDKIQSAGYDGLRISQSLPSRGQRSKTNAQTVKRKGRLQRKAERAKNKEKNKKSSS